MQSLRPKCVTQMEFCKMKVACFFYFLDKASKPIRIRHRLKSWKSSNTLNEPVDSSSEDEVIPSRSRYETKRKESRCKLNNLAPIAAYSPHGFSTAPGRSTEFVLSRESVNTYTE